MHISPCTSGSQHHGGLSYVDRNWNELYDHKVRKVVSKGVVLLPNAAFAVGDENVMNA